MRFRKRKLKPVKLVSFPADSFLHAGTTFLQRYVVHGLLRLGFGFRVLGFKFRRGLPHVLVRFTKVGRAMGARAKNSRPPQDLNSYKENFP